jgi:hypothetical protein
MWGGGGGGGVLEHKMCILIFIKFLSENFPVLRSTQRYIFTNVQKSSCCSCQILKKLGASRQIFGETSNVMKIGPLGAELFHTDGQTHG